MAETWASSSATTGNAQIWATWTDATSDSGTSSNDVIWSGWATGNTGSAPSTYVNVGYAPSPETEEQRQARTERERQHQEELEAALLEKEAARQRAEALLRETLDKKQREQFDQTKWFYVISQSGKSYRIRHGWTGNVDEIDREDMIVASYCIQPQTRVPIEDSMLIQKLMLEVDEQRFLQIANKTTYREPRPQAV